ncbi:MAG: Glu/Leu/Phe/Val dehydrogenase dimerization domain-containing protein [Alphaproteobacteria bacterium]
MTLIFKDLKHDNYERVLLAQEELTGFHSITAIHNTKRGPALGGCRYFAYQSDEDQLSDVLKLSKAMTYKNSLANLDFGGGKATVNAKVAKNQFYELFAQVLKTLDGTYITAGDIGMLDEDLIELKKLSPHVCSTKGSDSGLSTAFGVFNAMIGYQEFQNQQSNLENKKILIKGYGKVGARLAQFCKNSGAIVEVIDFESKKDLIERDGFVYIKRYQDTNFNQIDIFSPCATGGDLNQEFLDFSKIKKVNCVLGAANNQLADNNIEQKLFNEGITYCPDYCVNAGGVIILALRSSIKEDMEYDEPEANKKLTGIKDQLKNILLLSQNKSQLSTISSNELAEQGFQ